MEAYLGIIRPIALGLKRSLPPGIQIEDLESAGREALLSALRSYDSRRSIPIESWIRFKVRGGMIDSVKGKAFREARHEAIREDVDESSDPGPETDAVDRQAASRMRAAIASLTPKLRQVVKLRYRENLSERETARRIGLTVDAVKRRRSRAVRGLKIALGSESMSVRAIALAFSDAFE